MSKPLPLGLLSDLYARARPGLDVPLRILLMVAWVTATRLASSAWVTLCVASHRLSSSAYALYSEVRPRFVWGDPSGERAVVVTQGPVEITEDRQAQALGCGHAEQPEPKGPALVTPVLPPRKEVVHAKG